MDKRPQLMLMSGPESGRRYEVPANGLRLGRSSSNDIHIPDEELSRNHCFFEQVGELGIRIVDLASANGTFVNGSAMGTDPIELKLGDVIELGKTRLKVVGEELPEAATSVDLGLGASAAEGAAATANAPSAAAPRKKWMPLIIGVLAVFALAALSLALFVPTAKEDQQVTGLDAAANKEDLGLREFYYEKISANQDGIFRYELTLSAAGVLQVTMDDVPAQNRHVVKSQQVDDTALKELGEVLAFERLRDFDREYLGLTSDPLTHESVRLTVVYGSQVKEIKIVNVSEPDEFQEIRKRLETFSKNQLGVWALQYSREKLIELSEESIRLAKSKWEDREVRYGNLYESMAAYKEALFYLETVNPKPACNADAEEGLKRTTAELERRFNDQRFLANRAINLAQWETAQRELQTLIEMVPDRADPRNREASAKLMDVEKRLKGAAK